MILLELPAENDENFCVLITINIHLQSKNKANLPNAQRHQLSDITAKGMFYPLLARYHH